MTDYGSAGRLPGAEGQPFGNGGTAWTPLPFAPVDFGSAITLIISNPPYVGQVWPRGSS